MNAVAIQRRTATRLMDIAATTDPRTIAKSNATAVSRRVTQVASRKIGAVSTR
jgi:hypothetical protein